MSKAIPISAANKRHAFLFSPALLLLLAAVQGNAYGQSLDGEWTGTSVNNEPFSFIVENNAVVMINGSLTFPEGCLVSTESLVAEVNLPIVDNAFNYDIASDIPAGFGISGSVTGRFDSASTATGLTTLNIASGSPLGCAATLSVGWTTSKVGGDSGDTPNYTQVWYDPIRTGQGVQLLQTGNTISGAWYLYDQAGEDTWVTFVGNLNDNRVTADLLAFSGPALGGTWDNALVSATQAGSVTIDFSSPTAATFDYTVNGVSDRLMLEVFDEEATGDFTKVWYDPARTGQGVQILQSGDRVSGAWYVYDANGESTWRTFIGTLDGDTVSAELLDFSGPRLGTTWNNSQVASDSDGTVTITFASPQSASFNYVLDGASGTLSLVPFTLQ